MEKYALFFSWQSDKPEAGNVIQRKLRDVKSELEKEDICLIIDQDTRGRAGTKQIDQTVLAKIDACDVFIADITPVASLKPKKEGGHVKLLPNANVMYEYGYAKGIGKMNRCILLANLAAGENKEDLPFDINHDTITEFKTAFDLEKLKLWIFNIINMVKKERATSKSNLSASILFKDRTDEITIFPTYVKHIYVSKASFQKQVALANEALFQNKIGGLISSIKTFPVVKTTTKTIYLDRCPLSFIIKNHSDFPIENCKSYIKCENPDVHFFEKGEECTFDISVFNAKRISVSDNEIYRHRELINPLEILPVGDVFISVPHNLSEFTLDWHISSAQGNSYGKLHINVRPKYDFKYVGNDNLVGESQVEGKVITE